MLGLNNSGLILPILSLFDLYYSDQQGPLFFRWASVMRGLSQTSHQIHKSMKIISNPTHQKQNFINDDAETRCLG